MNKGTGIVIGVVGLLVVGAGVYASTVGKSSAPVDVQVADSVMEKEEAMKKEEMMKQEAGGMEKSEAMMKAGVYEAYASEKLARAQTGDVVLFFHASWCPSCRGLNSDIEVNKAAIPEGVSILKLDYDKEIELKKKYGVTTQHTLVQVDKDGNLIKKWSGGSKLSSLVAEIQ